MKPALPSTLKAMDKIKLSELEEGKQVFWNPFDAELRGIYTIGYTNKAEVLEEMKADGVTEKESRLYTDNLYIQLYNECGEEEAEFRELYRI